MSAPVWITAFVLHRRPYRETSYLVDFFTLESGRVSAVAKGVKNSKGDRKSLLQPFGLVRIQLRGKTELKNLSQIEAADRMTVLTGTALFCGMYLNELINRILPQGLASELMFDQYQRTLQALQHTDTPDVPLREFEFGLLEELGQLPDWLTDARSGEAVTAEHWYRFMPENGIVLARQVGEKGSFPGYALQQMVALDWTPAARKAAKLISRHALFPLLGDKPLKSRELFR